MKSFREFVEEYRLTESPIYEEESCPVATQNLKVNTKNRDAAIKEEHIQYGPLNVDEPGDYWKDIAEYWDTTEEAAKKSNCGNCVAFDISERMKECMPGKTSDDDGELGYCWMHHFKCHSARSCRTWAKGGPIDKDKVSLEWQEKANIDEGYGSGLSESVEMDTLKGIADKLKREYGFEVSLSKSTLGGGEPSYFLKVFGPKDTWKNNIALNSPFHMTIRIADGELEMPTVSYQVRNAKAKMRKTKFKNDADLEKKMMDYFKKNKSKFDGILGEEFVSEDTVFIQKRMKALGGNQFANDTGFAKKVSNAVTKAGLTAKLQGDKIAVTGDADKIEKLKKSLKGVTFIKESKGSDYTINHKTFSSAVQHAKDQVEKQGYEIEDDEWDRKVAMGPRKPGRGKTNKYTIDLMKNGKETRRKLQMQVYYDEGRYELNMYIS